MSETSAPGGLPSQMPGVSAAETEKLQAAFKDIAERSQKLLQGFSERYQADGPETPDPLRLTQTFMDFTAKMLADPAKLVQAQMELWQQYVQLWQVTAQRLMGQKVEPVAEPAKGDKRFNDPAWKEEVVFDYLKQSYLLTARWLQGTVKEVEGIDDKTARKIEFYTRQFVDAMSPSNFAMTNPQVLKATVETKGENLIKGLQNLLIDLERGKGKLAIRQTDMKAFKVGENVASSPGKVVYQNELMQLIQYAPLTEQVYAMPLLIVPPWINKFYILDLKPENSFIKWATEAGYTVFVISWVNPDEKLTKLVFDDYMRLGPLSALDAIETATGEKQVSAIGYCIGGTLMATTLAYMAARGDDRIAACTFFTAQVDFSEPGELGVFIDEDQLAGVEQVMSKQGYLDGKQMLGAFTMLRSNDLVWSRMIHEFYLGEKPAPNDLMAWNADATRMPARMHADYLRDFYLDNKLAYGRYRVGGRKISLTDLHLPILAVGTESDHVAPWKSVFKIHQLTESETTFILTNGGHNAGILSEPGHAHRHHRVATRRHDAAFIDADTWFETVKPQDGSWWPSLATWLAEHSGQAGPTPPQGNAKAGFPAQEDAPGSYVLVP